MTPWRIWQIDRDQDPPHGYSSVDDEIYQRGSDPAGLFGRTGQAFQAFHSERENRNDIPTPGVAAGAKSWKSGTTLQVQLVEVLAKISKDGFYILHYRRRDRTFVDPAGKWF